MQEQKQKHAKSGGTNLVLHFRMVFLQANYRFV